MARNNFQTFNDIPGLPELRRLGIEENFITNLEGLNPKKYPKLVRLTLKLNPVAREEHYRKHVKQALPSLRMLDGTPI